MLISARDLVLRLDSADERAIRVGLSGNLCRCTGYVGIVRAVRSVIEDRRRHGILPIPGAGREQLGPVGSGKGARTGPGEVALPPAPVNAGDQEQVTNDGAADTADFVPDHSFENHFTIAAPPDKVFEMFGDIRRVAACLPGASLTGQPTPERVEGMIRVKLGPIAANFRGVARIDRDHANRSGRIVGMGSDQRSRSSTRGEIRYRLVPIGQGTATGVELSIGYSLRGMLAQIAREGLVRDLAARLTADFARNLDRQLSRAAESGPAEPARAINGATLIFDLLRLRVRRIVRMVRGR
jgi:carbon-monoxide dehydrogenase small subunit